MPQPSENEQLQAQQPFHWEQIDHPNDLQKSQ
jgi:hypothetical protein